VSVKFDAGFFEGKLPVDGGLGGVALGYASRDVGRELGKGGDTLVQALADNGRELKLDHVEPGRVFGRVVHLKARGQRPGFGGGQVLIEDGIGVGVEVILHEHDFLGLRVVGTQLLHEAAVVGPGAAGRNLD